MLTRSEKWQNVPILLAGAPAGKGRSYPHPSATASHTMALGNSRPAAPVRAAGLAQTLVRLPYGVQDVPTNGLYSRTSSTFTELSPLKS